MLCTHLVQCKNRRTALDCPKIGTRLNIYAARLKFDPIGIHYMAMPTAFTRVCLPFAYSFRQLDA